MRTVKALPQAAQASALNETTDQLQVFATPHGWPGPNELLICSATADAAVQRRLPELEGPTE